MDVLDNIIWGNTVLKYLLVFAGIIITWGILKLTKKKILQFVKKITARTSNNFDDILIDVAEKFVLPFLYLFFNYSILMTLELPLKLSRVLDVAISLVTIYYIVRAINFLIHTAVVLFMQKKGEPPERIKQLNGMLLVVKAVIWIMGIIMLIDNLGYDITTVIAGLGVGGIAIALAAQNILGDLFSYLVIFFDKPFEIGDFITMGAHSGVVEKIGIKTTHVRSLDGQQLIMPNAEMATSVIHNFKRLQRRRMLFSIGVVYKTPHYQLKRIPDYIKSIINKKEQLTLDRVHLKSFGDFSVNFEIVYYVESADYQLYMNLHHEVLLDIFHLFEEQGIEFAFPTQTILLDNQDIQMGKEQKDITFK